jgi:hypothetical protein
MTYVDDIIITTDCESMRKEVSDAINKEVTLDDRGSSSLSWHELRVSQGAEVLGDHARDLHQGPLAPP